MRLSVSTLYLESPSEDPRYSGYKAVILYEKEGDSGVLGTLPYLFSTKLEAKNKAREWINYYNRTIK